MHQEKIKNKNQSGKRQKIVESQEKKKRQSWNKPNRIKKHEFKYDGKDTF